VFLKPALKCSPLQEVGDFEAKSFVLTQDRQFLVVAFMDWFYFFMARTAKP
jgi:hypothetical protein